MYNRYIPQPDGSYRRNRVQEPQQRQPERRPPPPPPQRPQEDGCEVPCKQDTPICPPPRQEQFACPRPRSQQNDGLARFFSQLLPKDFDTGDLIVVLLLLLLASDCEENRSTALLTLALYLFM